MIDIEWPGRKGQLAVIALAALLVTAGCAGLGSPDETGNDTVDSEDPDDPGDDESGDENETDGTDDENSTDETDSAFSDLDPVEEDVTAAELLNDSVAALDTVESYRLQQNITTVQRSNNQEITTQNNQTGRIDRAQQRAGIEGVTASQGRSIETKQYLLNDSLYESNERIAQQYGTQWVRTNLTGSYEQVFEQFDSINQLERVFANATGTVEGQTEIDGEEVYAINATVDSDTIVETRQSVNGVERFQLNLWLSTETALPRQVTEDSALNLSTARGNFTQQTDSLLAFSYEDVDVTLPEAAEGAPTAEEVTGQ
ncbi:LppX_LprAFG lipoprotein [Halovenus sp. HT40]|uniref:LppX_LprAFG lipoprotein n=1 Tax=Halovenus sp. HT40 TaxID=3126691 RepID=UPI00300F2F02